MKENVIKTKSFAFALRKKTSKLKKHNHSKINHLQLSINN